MNQREYEREGTESRTPFVQELGTVRVNQLIARDTWRLRIECPSIAARIRPGQFVMMRVSGRTDPLLARPYALFDLGPVESGSRASSIEIVYLVVGNGTRALAGLLPGDRVDLWGPLGNTFPEHVTGHLVIVAGGIGQTPFVGVIRELLGLRVYGGIRPAKRPRKVTVLYGTRTKEFLAGVAEFEATGATLRIATDDGSAGHRGYVTELVSAELASSDPPEAIFGCGPEPMLERLARIAAEANIPCWVSLETKMACGYGVCFSCVAPIKDQTGWDYRRVCLEGPIFPAARIEWDSM